jgi:hypothetical protein
VLGAAAAEGTKLMSPVLIEVTVVCTVLLLSPSLWQLLQVEPEPWRAVRVRPRGNTSRAGLLSPQRVTLERREVESLQPWRRRKEKVDTESDRGRPMLTRSAASVAELTPDLKAQAHRSEGEQVLLGAA